jgi:hypothetical protein
LIKPLRENHYKKQLYRPFLCGRYNSSNGCFLFQGGKKLSIIKKIVSTCRLPVLLTAFLLPFALGAAVYAVTPAPIYVTAPAGNASYDFSVNLTATESAPYAGAEYGITISGAGALQFKSFDMSNSIAGANASPFMSADGVHYFGFFSDSNKYTGTLNVGTMRFTYTGDATQTITIKSATYIRINGTNVVKTVRVSNQDIVVSRATTNTGGGNVTQTTPTVVIGNIETPLATAGSFPAFIKGFEDNTFRGNDFMTREQFVTILARLKNPNAIPSADKSNPSFADVSSNRWSYDAIEWAKGAGIAVANSEGKFRPADILTRAEMAVMLVLAEKLTVMANNTFSDLEGHSAASDILKAVEAGIFTGYPDGTFNPNGGTNRYEAVTALVRYLLGGEPEDAMWQNMTLTFTDVSRTYWAYKYVALSVNGYTHVSMQ